MHPVANGSRVPSVRSRTKPWCSPLRPFSTTMRVSSSVSSAMPLGAQKPSATTRSVPSGSSAKTRPLGGIGGGPPRIGEEDGAVGRDAQVVGHLHRVGCQVADAAVGRDALQPRLHVARRRDVAEDLEDREVDAAVLGDEEAAVGGQRGAVGASAGVGHHLVASGIGPDAPEHARGHARAHDGSLGGAGARWAPDRAFAELGSDADDVRSVHRSILPDPPSGRAGTVARNGHDEWELPR